MSVLESSGPRNGRFNCGAVSGGGVGRDGGGGVLAKGDGLTCGRRESTLMLFFRSACSKSCGIG